jgi:hypothetical protein
MFEIRRVMVAVLARSVEAGVNIGTGVRNGWRLATADGDVRF